MYNSVTSGLFCECCREGWLHQSRCIGWEVCRRHWWVDQLDSQGKVCMCHKLCLPNQVHICKSGSTGWMGCQRCIYHVLRCMLGCTRVHRTNVQWNQSYKDIHLELDELSCIHRYNYLLLEHCIHSMAHTDHSEVLSIQDDTCIDQGRHICHWHNCHRWEYRTILLAMHICHCNHKPVLYRCSFHVHIQVT